MIENPSGCVLQWAGHAGYVTERFSGLFARQALVDVTLVCEEQKLRVHKLVLASNSTYFEEILQEDLGEEPIIFLKDLNFEILKAMVEFMYCGETTISHQLLPSLLSATRTFKVKELASVIGDMMASNTTSKILKSDISLQIDVRESKITTDTPNDTTPIDVRCDETEIDLCSLLYDISSNDANPIENQSLESNIIIDPTEQELEHTLYEESQNFETEESELSSLFLISNPTNTDEDKTSNISTDCKLNDTPNRCSESSRASDDIYCTDDELKPILYEQCCDFSDVEDCEDGPVALSRSCLQQIEKDFAQYSFDTADVPSKVGKCVKVYTHKRRKSTEEVKSKIVDMNSVIPTPPSTDCIDLLEEPSTNDIPVTLLTSLDMESAEYIISLSTESIQSIVGATMNEQHALLNCKGIKRIINYDSSKENLNKKEESSSDTENTNSMKPILRRSSRLNHQENEETANNNESIGDTVVGEKHMKRSYSTNRTDLCIRGKRKAKDTDRKVPEQQINNTNHISRKNFNNTRSHRNSRKLIVKRNNKSACTVPSKEKYEQKVRTGSKAKSEISDKVDSSGSIFSSAAFNTIEHINRALWGDLSDVSENYENIIDLSDYTPHTEIPFAVGLLPLRTALEKMQATPDYQPRKTRSSVAPTRHDVNYLKRKNHSSLDTGTGAKKQNANNTDGKTKAKTVCHIQIRTAPSQYIRSRKKFLSTEITSSERQTVVNRQ